MGKIISINMPKGGSGKTTTVNSLAGCLSDSGYNCLVVDLDPIGNLTYSSNIRNTKNNIYDLMKHNLDYDEVIQFNKYYDIIPSGSLLNRSMQEFDDLALKNILDPIRNKYDYILIDTPPSLDSLCINSLVAADYVIIPFEPSFYTYQALEKIYDVINDITIKYNRDLQILGILLVRYKEKEILNRFIRCMLERYIKEHNLKVFNTFINESCLIKEAQGLSDIIIKTNPNSRLSTDYKLFTNEILDILHDNRLRKIV